MNVGYIVSQYPKVSHSFVQREVLALRELGWSVTTVSIRRAQPQELLTVADRDEARTTHVVVAFQPLRLIAAIIAPMLKHPGGFLEAFRTAWRLRRPGWRGLLWSLFYFVEALIVHRIARGKGLAHLHAHFANVASDVAMIAAVLGRRGSGQPATFSFTMHGPTEFFDVAEHRLAEKARAAKFIICISDFARSQLMALLSPGEWGKLHVVHCGVDPRQFAAPATRNGPRRKSKVTNILTVARLVSVKGHAILFRSLEELLLRGHNIRLTVIGDGPLRGDLEEFSHFMGIQDRVSFLGNVGQDVIHEHYGSADLFVLPSFAEGVPVVLMEAMAAGCPVVATRINGIPELIEDGISGLLVSPGRPDLLADAMERLISGPRIAERMAMAACEKVRRDFNLRTAAQQLDAILRLNVGPSSRRAEDTFRPGVTSASSGQVRLEAAFISQAQRGRT